MRHALALTAVLAVTTVTAAEPRSVHVADGVDYVVPTGSPVLLASKGPHLLATFKGRFRISGTYHYGWLTDDPTATAADGDLDLYFLPNKADANLLPYWAPRGHVHEIHFSKQRRFHSRCGPTRS